MSFSSSSSQATTISICFLYPGTSTLATSLVTSTIFLCSLSLCLANMLLYSRDVPQETL
uniref:Uncharacterized protein n=1 Tax=Arundo donax TaxID=35708 RepID=A0A0A9DKY2_ARUDO